MCVCVCVCVCVYIYIYIYMSLGGFNEIRYCTARQIQSGQVVENEVRAAIGCVSTEKKCI